MVEAMIVSCEVFVRGLFPVTPTKGAKVFGRASPAKHQPSGACAAFERAGETAMIRFPAGVGVSPETRKGGPERSEGPIRDFQGRRLP